MYFFVLQTSHHFYHQKQKRKYITGFKLNFFSSGGESKDEFWKMVHLSTDILPKNKPRYLMGVGFAVDLVVCCALGVDMFDCVFPTRTAVSTFQNFSSSVVILIFFIVSIV